ncbi:uncharacterized protein TNCV_4153091 [Trichonephila clavipes]|nr:uncharacterized protein TNCV_4153091 [Trichonephila clavipes]
MAVPTTHVRTTSISAYRRSSAPKKPAQISLPIAWREAYSIWVRFAKRLVKWSSKRNKATAAPKRDRLQLDSVLGIGLGLDFFET